MAAIPSYEEIKDLLEKGMKSEACKKIMELKEEVIRLLEKNKALEEEKKSLKKELTK